MKKCNVCGARLDDTAVACDFCGSADLEIISSQNSESNVSDNSYPAPVGEVIDINDNGNIVLGVIGAFLFSIVGGILYFVIYQFGFLAGICGFVMFALANFGYRTFAKTKNKLSIAALASAIVATIIMILFAEYACLAFDFYKFFEAEGATIFDAIVLVPSYLTEEGVRAILGDLAFSYIFAILATGRNVADIIKARKNSK